MTEKTAYAAVDEYEQGILAGLTAALAALNGHGFHDTAHDRVRRLLACDECGHGPEMHPDGAECLARVLPQQAHLLAACHCAEYEVQRLPRVGPKPESGAS
jgi:hypothetical protein